MTMLKRFRLLKGFHYSSQKSLPDPARVRSTPPSLISEAVQEVAVYIHRFHNLDLFQQGWYQLKLTMRWEDNSGAIHGFPARVVQYEAKKSPLDNDAVVWKIDDTDHSFYTRPFQIKYARQDVFLSVMVSFNLAVKGAIKSSAILKFELLYTPLAENIDLQHGLSNFTASVHEFRIPPMALLGLHTYCPLHFDCFHAVLVDLSIHSVLLKATAAVPILNINSDGFSSTKLHRESNVPKNQSLSLQDGGVSSEDVVIWKALCDSRNLFLKEFKKLAMAIDKSVEDLECPETRIINSVCEILDNHWIKDTNFDNRTTKRQHRRLKRSELLSSNFDMIEGYQALGSQLSAIWNAFLRFHRENRIAIIEYLRRTWEDERKMEWSLWLVHSNLEIGKMKIKQSSQDPASLAASQANLHRKSLEQLRISGRYLQDMQIFGNISRLPIIYFECLTVAKHSKSTFNSDMQYSNRIVEEELLISPENSLETLPPKRNEPGNNKRTLRVVVFVHGFQGNHLDLRLVRNQWLLIDPGADCLMSEANENKTYCDFQEMGKRLANEVQVFLKHKFSSPEKIASYGSFRLSFVGHSIGNIIIRSALADAVMKPYLKNLYTYLSVSGPHLGYLYSTNTIFNSGMWLFKKLVRPACMHQLTYTDEQDIENSFLFRLSQERTFEWFQNVILVSSPQDGYVPYHSARVEMCQAGMRDSRKATSYATMLKNCLGQILLPSLFDRTFIRADVNFDTSAQANTFNNFIGRAAHIEFLESDIFAKFLMWSFPKLFS